MKIIHFLNVNCLNDFLLRIIQRDITNALRRRKAAYLVLSGGRSPRRLYEKLSKLPLAWKDVVATLTDERCLSSLHPESNEYMINNTFLKNDAENIKFIGFSADCFVKNPEGLPKFDSFISRLPVFDVVILGMGEDGHVASLFPCADEINFVMSKSSSSIEMISPKTAPYTRLSMTIKRLLRSKKIYIYIIGEEKLNRLQHYDKGLDKSLPIHAIIKAAGKKAVVFYAPN